jgi:hypothetical protein
MHMTVRSLTLSGRVSVTVPPTAFRSPFTPSQTQVDQITSSTVEPADGETIAMPTEAQPQEAGSPC